jgi:hypothetical protein
MSESIKKQLIEALNYHEIDKMLNSIKSTDCDCCQYFDMDVSRFGWMKNPIYYIIEKHEIQELVFIAPKQYIFNIARGFGISYDDAMGSAYSEERGKSYAEAMKKGDKFPVGYYTDSHADQEGRHRAAAAMILGCKQIPVIKITRINRDFGRNFIEQYKELSREQLDTMFKEKGYHGITDLDFRTFTNYIEFRL